MLGGRSSVQTLIALLILLAGGQAQAQAEGESFQGQMSHSLGRTSSISVSTGTSLNASASASMDPGYDSISVSRVDLAPQSFNPETGILDSSLPRQATRVSQTISSGTGVTSNTLSSSTQSAQSTSQEWITQARRSANEAVGSSFQDYAQGVLNDGDTPNPEITDAETWQAQWDSNYNTAYEDVLSSASEEERSAVDRYQKEESSEATGSVTTTGLAAETNVALSEGTHFSSVITPKGYVYDHEASMAKGAPVYTCQSVSCQYETPVLTRDELIEQINASHTTAKDKADADVAGRVKAETAFGDGYVNDESVYNALVNQRLEKSLPVLYIIDAAGEYTPVQSFAKGQEVYWQDPGTEKFTRFLDDIYQVDENGSYIKADEVVEGGSYVRYRLGDYDDAVKGYKNSSLFDGWTEDQKEEAVSEVYGNGYQPGRAYPVIQLSTFKTEAGYNESRDVYSAHANRLNYDKVYDNEYRLQVNSWLTEDQKILSNRQNAEGNAGVGVSTNMNVTTRDSSFQQAFIQAFN